MPRTPPTIVAPLPRDPRVMELAKALNVSRREAYAAAVEAWAWMSMMERDGVVPDAEPASLDGAVDITGMGQAMLNVGLVGVVDGGLVLPAELRRLEPDQRGGSAAAADVGEDGRAVRRQEQNREAARRYRKRARLTGSKAKPATGKAQTWRSLGHVAGHEVRVFEGPHGCYAMLLGATVGGEPCRKVTAGDKAWSLDTVRLVDALPLLVAKWQTIHQKESGRQIPAPLVPTYAALRDDADRLTMLAKLAADGARHADAADASSRHADASALASSSSGERSAHKSAGGNGLDAPGASSPRHADGVSSISSISSLSLSSPEEKREREEREEKEIKQRRRKLGMRRRIKFDELCGAARDRWFVAQFVAGEQKKLPDPDAIAADIGLTREEVLTLGGGECWLRFRRQILDSIESTDDDMPASRYHEPAEARGDIVATTEPVEGDRPAAGILEAPAGEVNRMPDEGDAGTPDRIIDPAASVACGSF
jgi:hypothetical protein